ncbi:hypothetical protein COO60DRAFT_286473 [Scenedesmus sp. NREL 46B-D3]|nr:hypothetical protein COO60DRAFT_286473 [Scenedesmus sp. NREL 46B-D3]
MSGTTAPPAAGGTRSTSTGFAAAQAHSSRSHVISTRNEKVDVAIVGGGLCGLACAAALHKVYPDCKIKVYEQRSQPEELDETSPGDERAAPDLLVTNAMRALPAAGNAQAYCVHSTLAAQHPNAPAEPYARLESPELLAPRVHRQCCQH